MKKSVLILFISFFSVPVFSQIGAYIHAGYNGNWGKFSAYNQLISRYNQSHQGITNFMDPVKFLHGPSAGIGLFLNGMNINFDFRNGHQLSSAVLSDSISNITREDIKLRINTLSLSFGSYPNVENAIAIGFGISVDLGNAAILNRRASLELVDDTLYYVLGSHYFVGFSPHIQLFVKPGPNIIFSLKPYYQVFSSVNDFSKIDLTLNPMAGPQNDLELNEVKFNHFGVDFSVGFSL